LIELELTAMAHGGSALGRHEGRVIFVPYAIPGEVVRVRLTEEHTRWARADLVEVLRPSPHRVEPPCPYFGPDQCGGCQFQHIDYDGQVRFKQEVVADQLARIGKLEVAVEEAIGAAQPWDYRNNVQFHVTDEGYLGFLTADTNNIIPVEDCLIIDPLLDEMWTAFDMHWPEIYRLSLRCGSATGERMAIFELDEYQDFDIEVDFPVSCILMMPDGEAVVLMGGTSLVEYVAGRDYRISAGSFFQVNTGGAGALVALVREALEPRRGDTLLDLYCGVGLFGLALAGEVGRVLGVESDPSAAADFVVNAADLDNVELLEGKAQQVLGSVEGPVDLVILDPPRAGAGERALGEVARLGPRRIAYVSCEPATLARDARHLVDAGYGLEVVQPLDMFPQTFHVESVNLFVRRDG
jgi:23S rRNA (uracil1939-C5)-methyltransferase